MTTTTGGFTIEIEVLYLNGEGQGGLRSTRGCGYFRTSRESTLSEAHQPGGIKWWGGCGEIIPKYNSGKTRKRQCRRAKEDV